MDQCHRPTCTNPPAYEGWARYEIGANAFSRELGFPSHTVNRRVVVCEAHKTDLIGFQNERTEYQENSSDGPLFGYPCQECGIGTVQDTIMTHYPTRIKGIPYRVPQARVGVCDRCGAKHFAAQETKRWEAEARAAGIV